MLVLIACVEDSKFSARVSASFPDYSPASHEFSLPRPMGDDWLQCIRHIPDPTPLVVRVEGQVMFVVFDTLQGAQKFEQWLKEAVAEQGRGYRAMRG